MCPTTAIQLPCSSGRATISRKCPKWLGILDRSYKGSRTVIDQIVFKGLLDQCAWCSSTSSCDFPKRGRRSLGWHAKLLELVRPMCYEEFIQVVSDDLLPATNLCEVPTSQLALH